MKKSLLLVVLLAIWAAPAAFAESFTLQSYQITADNGIGISHDQYTPVKFNLTQNNPETGWFDLFDIYAQPIQQAQTANISVKFTFSKPDMATGTVNGDTSTEGIWLFGDGSVQWDGPAYVNFKNGEQLKVELKGVDFGVTSLGEKDVQANITLVPNPVPEPGTLAMLGSGLLGLGGMIRRKFGR